MFSLLDLIIILYKNNKYQYEVNNFGQIRKNNHNLVDK